MGLVILHDVDSFTCVLAWCILQVLTCWMQASLQASFIAFKKPNKTHQKVGFLKVFFCFFGVFFWLGFFNCQLWIILVIYRTKMQARILSVRVWMFLQNECLCTNICGIMGENPWGARPLPFVVVHD